MTSWMDQPKGPERELARLVQRLRYLSNCCVGRDSRQFSSATYAQCMADALLGVSEELDQARKQITAKPAMLVNKKVEACSECGSIDPAHLDWVRQHEQCVR